MVIVLKSDKNISFCPFPPWKSLRLCLVISPEDLLSCLSLSLNSLPVSISDSFCGSLLLLFYFRSVFLSLLFLDSVSVCVSPLFMSLGFSVILCWCFTLWLSPPFHSMPLSDSLWPSVPVSLWPSLCLLPHLLLSLSCSSFPSYLVFFS